VPITGSVIVVAELIGKMQGSYKLTFRLSLYLPNITYREPRELSGVTEAIYERPTILLLAKQSEIVQTEEDRQGWDA
jgi:hypothetical protein